MVAYQEYILLAAQQFTQRLWAVASCLLKHGIFFKSSLSRFIGLDAHVNFCANEEVIFLKWLFYFLCQFVIVTSEPGACYDDERILLFQMYFLAICLQVWVSGVPHSWQIPKFYFGIFRMWVCCWHSSSTFFFSNFGSTFFIIEFISGKKFNEFGHSKCKAPFLWRKVRCRGRRVTSLPELPWASQRFMYFLAKRSHEKK